MKEWNNNPLIKRYEQFQALSPHNTKAKFARQCGISPSLMSQYLKNQVLVSSKSMGKLCKVLKCQPNDLVERENKEN